MSKKKIIFYILDFVILILSYMLCDYISEKINLIMGMIIACLLYVFVYFILYKLFNNKGEK